MPGVYDKNADLSVKARLKHLVNGLPINSCAFHSNIPTSGFKNPISQFLHFRDERTEGSRLCLWLIFYSTFNQTGNNDISVNIQPHSAGQNILHKIPSCRIAGLGIARVGVRILLLVLFTSVMQQTAVLLGNSSTLNKRGDISAKVQSDFACYIQYTRFTHSTHLLYFHSQL